MIAMNLSIAQAPIFHEADPGDPPSPLDCVSSLYVIWMLIIVKIIITLIWNAFRLKNKHDLRLIFLHIKN